MLTDREKKRTRDSWRLMKVGDQMFIPALEKVGKLVSLEPLRVTHMVGKIPVTEMFEAEDVQEAKCNAGDHHWDNGGMDPTHCLRCGMSFWRYAFTECP